MLPSRLYVTWVKELNLACGGAASGLPVARFHSRITDSFASAVATSVVPSGLNEGALDDGPAEKLMLNEHCPSAGRQVVNRCRLHTGDREQHPVRAERQSGVHGSRPVGNNPLQPCWPPDRV